MTKNKSILYILVVITFVITAISYRSYIKYASLNMDDYWTFEFAPAEYSVLQACKTTTDYLYGMQKRYQPVRLCAFVAFTRFFDEQSSVYYNFALHLVNILLLFLFLRKFNVGSIFSLISVLLFAVFGRFRYMDSSSAMIGGSGLNLFFILSAFLFLIKALQTGGGKLLRRYSYLVISALAYAGLVFSYEVAAPLFAPLVLVFYLFNNGKKGLLAPVKTKKTFYLLLYLIPLLFYIIFYRLLVKTSYEGVKIEWGPEILTRLKAYIDYTIMYPIQIHGLITAEFIILALYFGAIVFILKKTDESSIEITDKKRTGLRLLIFSAIFYPSTVVLFTLNHWLEPTSIMIHHTYLMTAASALLAASFFYNLQWILLTPFRKVYLVILIILLFPLVLINAERNTVKHYKHDASRVAGIRSLKNTLRRDISDIDKTEAIILKNFYFPYYDISSMEGAFMDWFRFRKYILSGREITKVKDGNIVFKGPLHRYIDPDKERRVANNRVMIFYVHPKKRKIVPYNDFIDFEKGLNLYQTMQVKNDCPKSNCTDKLGMEAILSNFTRNNYLNIWFKSRNDLDNFLKNVRSIEVNDERVAPERIDISGTEMSIDVSHGTDKINYFFLMITSSDDRFKESLRLIVLTKSIR